MYKLVDMKKWDRLPYYNHYDNIKCRYSLTCDIDISKYIEYKEKYCLKLYPIMLYCLTKCVNQMKEFRYDIIDQKVVLHDSLSPAYTILNDDKTFSVVESQYNENLKIFYENVVKFIAKYKNSGKIECNNIDCYTFNVSMLPWINFSSFDLSIKEGYDYLLPIFTIGKYVQDKEKWRIPLSISVNHKVCDGYHVAMFIKEVQKMLNNLSYEELI